MRVGRRNRWRWRCSDELEKFVRLRFARKTDSKQTYLWMEVEAHRWANDQIHGENEGRIFCMHEMRSVGVYGLIDRVNQYTVGQVALYSNLQDRDLEL